MNTPRLRRRSTVATALLVAALVWLLVPLGGGVGATGAAHGEEAGPAAPADPTETSTASPTAIPTQTSTATPTGSPTETSTSTPTGTPTSTPTDTPSGSATTSPTPTATPTPTVTVTQTVTASPSPSATDTPTLTPAPTPTVTPTEGTSDSFTVSDAQLRWGMSNEANNRAFAPGTFNFFSAGEVPNPGVGGTTLDPANWHATDGNVRIEKATPEGGYALATWAGLSTTPDGGTIPSPTSGVFSNHQVVIDGGTGKVNPAAGTAEIAWKGTFTVLSYSGMAFFTVTDPALTVTKKRARLTGTLGGYGSDQQDPTIWVALPDTEAVLADLPRESLVLPDEGGFTVTPAYAGVKYVPSPGDPAQVGGPYHGSFPTSFVNFLATAGTGAYWYSTGGSTDPYKAALPVTVNYAGEAAPTATPSPTGPTSSASATPTATPSTTVLPTPPQSRPAPPANPLPAAPAPVDAPSAAAVPTTDGSVLTATRPLLAPPPQVQETRLAPASAPPTSPFSEHRVLWLLGSALLLGAAVTTAINALLARSAP